MTTFIVCRQSMTFRDGQPCPGAVKTTDPTTGSVLWTIELPDIDALLAFIDEHGPMILDTPHAPGAPPWLTIYDDYIE